MDAFMHSFTEDHTSCRMDKASMPWLSTLLWNHVIQESGFGIIAL